MISEVSEQLAVHEWQVDREHEERSPRTTSGERVGPGRERGERAGTWRLLAHRRERRIARADFDGDVAHLEKQTRAAIGEALAIDRELGLGRPEPAARTAREEQPADRHELG